MDREDQDATAIILDQLVVLAIEILIRCGTVADRFGELLALRDRAHDTNVIDWARRQNQRDKRRG